MAERRAPFTQSDVSRVLRAWLANGLPAPEIVITPGRIVARPAGSSEDTRPNPWDES